jgi:hypothetical protein
MGFLTKDDLSAKILPEDLDIISQGDPEIIEKHLRLAEEEIRLRLSERYDVDAIFEETGNDRSLILVDKGANIALFLLHQALPSNAIPERRLFFYQEATGSLDKMAKGFYNLNLPAKLKPDGTEEAPRFMYGSTSPKNDLNGY